jgi:hypothetical protein
MPILKTKRGNAGHGKESFEKRCVRYDALDNENGGPRLRSVFVKTSGTDLANELLSHYAYGDRGENVVEHISPVDHFPNMLKHFSDERLLRFTIHFVQMTQDGSEDSFACDRAALCQHECERRGIRAPFAAGRWRG